MLSKNCRLVLDAIIAKGEIEKFMPHPIASLSKELNLPIQSVLAACSELEHDEFATIRRLSMSKSPPILESITLTEKGVYYKDLLKEQRMDYFKDKWIDFLALTISVIALIKSFWPEISLLLQK